MISQGDWDYVYELTHRQPFIVLVLPIDEFGPLVYRLATAQIVNRHSIHQQAVNPLVFWNQIAELQVQHRICSRIKSVCTRKSLSRAPRNDT